MASQCVICFTDCPVGVVVCDSDECVFASLYTYTLDNYVFDFYNQRNEEFLLIMHLAQHSAKLKAGVNPCPINTAKATVVASKIVSIMKDIDTDIELITRHGKDTYQAIKYILKNVLLDFGITHTLMFDTPVYEFIYSDVLDTRFNGSSYLFHGSPALNWYSIIDSGLKVFSGTPYMRNGAALGKGIYLSDNLSSSIHYSNNETCFGCMVGVFEVIGDLKQYKKGPDTYVVDKDSELRLKYLIVSKCNAGSNLFKLNRFFARDKTKLSKNTFSYVGNMKNKRLMMEIRNIMKQQAENKITDFVLLETTEITVWNVLLINIDKDTKLHSDMLARNIDNIHLEIRFESSYPLSPPFVRVIKPTFMQMTGHVTQGGSICAEVLTTSGWSPAINVESLIITVKAIISEDGRLGGCATYNLANAKNSYANMLRVHGWQ